MRLHEASTTPHFSQPEAQEKAGEMQLYYVSMDVRGDKPNEYGVYGIGTGMSRGVFYVRAKDSGAAIKRARAAIDGGLEPHIVAVGGYSCPSPERITINHASLEHMPFID